jgi:hypothetical protein
MTVRFHHFHELIGLLTAAIGLLAAIFNFMRRGRRDR